MRKNSVLVYKQIEEEGLLSKRRLQVYQALWEIGPATAAEVSSHDDKSWTNPAKGDNSHARLSELIKLGCVEEVGERKCVITGRNVTVYDVTDRLPKNFANLRKKKIKPEQIVQELLTVLDKPISAQLKVREIRLFAIKIINDLQDQKS